MAAPKPARRQAHQYNIETAAQRDGVCITTLRRAKFDLGVLSTKESVSGAWYWALPQNGQPSKRPAIKPAGDLSILGGRE
jgi:hypothetical protein